jgi:hypothetical protein
MAHVRVSLCYHCSQLLTGISNWSCSSFSNSYPWVKVYCPAASEPLDWIISIPVITGRSQCSAFEFARPEPEDFFAPQGTKVLREHWLIDRSLYVRGRWFSDTVWGQSQLYQQTGAVDSWLEIRYRSPCISTQKYARSQHCPAPSNL